MKTIRLPSLSNSLWIALGALIAQGCSSNLSRFDVMGLKVGGPPQITRAEVGDQGSGVGAAVVGPGGHRISRVTIGGYYLRRNDAQGPNSKAAAGLFGNSKATK